MDARVAAELPRLGHVIKLTTPKGNRYRWARDAPGARDVISGLRYGSTMPGGFTESGGSLARDPRVDYADLERLATASIFDLTGELVGEYRLEDTPNTSGDRFGIDPKALGWQAHLKDDNTAVVVYVTRSVSDFGEPTTQRRKGIQDVGGRLNGETGVSSASDHPENSDTPSIYTRFSRVVGGAATNWAESWYYGGGADLDSVASAVVSNVGVNAAHSSAIYLADDEIASSFDASTDTQGGSSFGISASASQDGRKYVLIQFRAGAIGAADVDWEMLFAFVRILGRTGLTPRGAWPDDGFYDADVVGHALDNFAPLLNWSDETLTPDTSFVIPEIAFTKPTNPGEIVKQATRFNLRDWAVWGKRTMYLHDRGERGRTWVARVEDADLEDTGPSTKRMWDQVIVEYQDVDGSTRTVGPPGSGANLETPELQDPEPPAPLADLGIHRSPEEGPLRIGISTPTIATEMGKRFLEQAKLLDHSGRAKLTGYVTDDRGTRRPYSQVQGGDQIRFVNASDKSERRIVKADKNEEDESVSIDLDAPPDGLAAVLERFGASLGKLGLS